MTGEPWLDRKRLAEHYSCSVRSIELALAEGMPHALAFGRVKFQVSAVEPWLREHGHLRDGDSAGSVVTGSTSEAATAQTAPPHDREVSPDGQES
jgi:hypothetical protein